MKKFLIAISAIALMSCASAPKPEGHAIQKDGYLKTGAVVDVSKPDLVDVALGVIQVILDSPW